ncbi:MAG: hypothetical protein LHV68_07340 [Elusimicrobia bacterium]|nr:hypothetical protein [Candidatus Liberimonas magnetica]
MKNSFLIKKYTKTVFPYFSGNGAAFHAVLAEYKGKKPFIIKNKFGSDESINSFAKIIGVKKAYDYYLAGKQPAKNNEYTFAFASRDAFGGKPIVKEMESKNRERAFSISWKDNFGTKQQASYVWGWISPVMFSSLSHIGTQQSSLEVKYSTKKLVYQIMYHRFYPLENCLELIKVDLKGHEDKIGPLKETSYKKSDFAFKMDGNFHFKCFQIEVDNPPIGHTYKVVWKLGLDQMIKYLEWLEANR